MQRGSSMRACGGGDTYHCSYGVQTNSGTGVQMSRGASGGAVRIGVKQCPSKLLDEVR